MGTFFISQGSLMDNAVTIPWPWGASSSAAGGASGGSAPAGGDIISGVISLSRGGGDDPHPHPSPAPDPSGGGGGGGAGGNGGFVIHIPSATMALFNTGAIILLVPLYDK